MFYFASFINILITALLEHWAKHVPGFEISKIGEGLSIWTEHDTLKSTFLIITSRCLVITESAISTRLSFIAFDHPGCGLARALYTQVPYICT